MNDICRIVDVDGTTVRLRGSGQPLTAADIVALAEIVRVVQAMPRDPEQEARQATAQERTRERNARLRGQS